MKNAIRELPIAAAGGSIAVAIGFIVVGILMVEDSRGDMAADLVAVAARAERAELERFAGGAPDRCVFAAPGRELCRWQIEGQVIAASGGRPAAGSVNLVCELPVREQGARGSCFVRERADAVVAEAGEPELPPVSAAGEPAQRARDAASFLAEARSVTELSLLVGDAPQDCHTVYAAQMCRWSLGAGTPERARLAALADQPDDELELRCLIPLEGPARPLQGCAVVSAE